MALANQARVNAIYAAIEQSDPNWNKLGPDNSPVMSQVEKDKVKAGLLTVFGADLTYLKANTEVTVSSTIEALALTSTNAAVGSPVKAPVAPASVPGSGTIK